MSLLDKIRLASTKGKFSEDPREAARQVAEFERGTDDSLRAVREKIAELEARIVALESV